MDEKQREALIHFTAACAVMTALYAYYSYNLIYLAGSVSVMALVFLFLRLSDAGDADGKIYMFLSAAAAVFCAARLFRLFSYPADYVGDEWNEIMDSYYTMSGNKGFFEFNRKFGASLLYFSKAITMLFMAAFRENIDMLRLIPAGAFMLTAAGMYFLGRELRDGKTGTAMVFIYCTSGLALYLSKQRLEHVYVPLFAVWGIYMFLRHIRERRRVFLAGAGAIFFLGFYTYASWCLMTILALYAVYEFREELGKKTAVLSAAFILLSAGVYATLARANGLVFSWAAGNTVFKDFFNPAAILPNILNLATFFTWPIATNTSFASTKPVYTFTEFIFMLGGLAYCIVNIKDKKIRLMLAGFIISLSTLLVTKDMEHSLRHVLILPFGAVLAGLFLRKMAGWKYAYILISVHVILAAGVFFYHYTEWGADLNISGTRRQAADYVNEKYGADGAHIMAGLNDPVITRMEAAYTRPAGWTGDTVVLAVESLWRSGIKSLFPGAAVKYFFFNRLGQNPPLCVFELPADLTKKQFYFMDMYVRKYAVLMWELDYVGIIKNKIETVPATTVNSLGDSLIFNYIFNAYGMLGREQQKLDFLLTIRPNFIKTAEYYFYLATAAYRAGRHKEALDLFKMAHKSAPEISSIKKVIENLPK